MISVKMNASTDFCLRCFPYVYKSLRGNVLFFYSVALFFSGLNRRGETVSKSKQSRMDEQVEIINKRAKSAGANEWGRKRKSEQAEAR